MSEFVPAGSPAPLFALFSVLRFENQRALRFTAGNSTPEIIVGLFVGLTGLASLILGLGALGYILFNGGWQIALGIMVISFVSGMIAALLLGMILRGDSFVVGLIATVLLWPVAYLIVTQTLSTY